MVTPFILSQILIGIAFLFDLASFQFNQRKYTLICFVGAASLISAHYFLLGQNTAGFIIALSATRFLASIFSTDVRLKYLFLLLVTVAGILTFDEIFDLLAIAAGYLATFAVFQPNEKLLRKLMMISTVCIITLNIFIFTPVGIVTETFFLSSNLLSYWRFYIKKKEV
jgi:hypothetical protein